MMILNLNYFKLIELEYDLGYESGNESELEIIQDDDSPQDKSAHVNIKSKTKTDKVIEN